MKLYKLVAGDVKLVFWTIAFDMEDAIASTDLDVVHCSLIADDDKIKGESVRISPEVKADLEGSVGPIWYSADVHPSKHVEVDDQFVTRCQMSENKVVHRIIRLDDSSDVVWWDACKARYQIVGWHPLSF